MSAPVLSSPLLKDVVVFEKGKPPAQQPYFGPDSETYLTPEYLRNGAGSEPIKASSNAVRVSDGDTIVLWDGSNAGEVLRARAGVLSSTMTRLRHRDTFDREYFFYALSGWEPHLKGQTSGSGIPHVDKEVLGKLVVPAFPLPEQRKIAEILTTVDRAIEETEALVGKQQRIKTGLMQDLLTRGIDAHGQLRTEATHAFKDSPLGRIPVEWEVVTIGDVISRIDAGWSPSCDDVTPAQGEWGVLKVSALSSGVFNAAESKRLPDSLKPIPDYEVRPNDVLISRANGVTELVGRCVYVHDTPNRLMLSDKTLRLVPRSTRITGFTLYMLLSSENSRRQIMNIISGSSGQKNLSQSQIKGIEIALPNLAEQNSINQITARSAQENTANVNALAKLRALKTALMQDLLTGRKRVPGLLGSGLQ
jgi:type I restriction enzyme S subunit